MHSYISSSLFRLPDAQVRAGLLDEAIISMEEALVEMRRNPNIGGRVLQMEAKRSQLLQRLERE
jgi:hypothetical protein